MRLSFSEALARLDWRVFVGHLLVFGAFALLGLGCGTVVSLIKAFFR